MTGCATSSASSLSVSWSNGPPGSVPPTRPARAKRPRPRCAHRYQQLTDEIGELDAILEPLVAAVAPNLVALNGVGTDVACQLLVTAGDNPDRLRSDAAFAHLCGASPIPASSGRASRHRLNRGGRAANAALYRVVICRLRWDPRTRAYTERRTKKASPKPKSSAASSDTSPERSTTNSTNYPLDDP
jgi:transposase